MLWLIGIIMKHSIFLSYPRPYNGKQENFIKQVSEYLVVRGFEPRTLGVTDYDTTAPLNTIRRILNESNGLITFAFRRTIIDNGRIRPHTKHEEKISNQWLTSPFCQIEPAMAYQMGLPILILRELGVIADGILEKGVVGSYMPEFNLNDSNNKYLESEEWNQIINQWESQVRTVIKKKGEPPQLY